MRRRNWILGLVFIVSAAAPAAARTGAAPTCVGGACLRSIQVDANRAPVLREAGTRLHQANIPSYASIYKSPFRGKRIEQGAILVAAVNKGNAGQWRSWMENIGSQSVGFITSHSPNGTGTGSGYLRVGGTFIDYSVLDPSNGRGRVGKDITAPDTGYSYGGVKGYTEATFLAKPAEVQAIMAFYQARANGMIKSPGTDKGKSQARLPSNVVSHLPGEGSVVKPVWSMDREGSGAKMKDLETDACAGRASSVLNPSWRKLFAWNVKYNLEAIKAYGVHNSIPELANLSADAPKQIDRFMKRYFGSASIHKQSNDPHAVVRKNAIHASMVTTFNDISNPLQTLEWGLTAKKYKSDRTRRVYPDQNSIQFYQPGQGQLYALPDWKPGQKQSLADAARQPGNNMYSPPRFDSERVPLNNFMNQIGAGL